MTTIGKEFAAFCSSPAVPCELPQQSVKDGAERHCHAVTRRVEIICDDRERGSGVVEALGRREDVWVCVRRLSRGDYLIDGRILVERKSVCDLARSIVDGRLFRQALSLKQCASCRAVLLVEGSREALAATGVRREAWQGALVTVEVLLGIPVMRSRDAEETARLLRYMADQVRRVASGAIQRSGYRPHRLLTRQLFILQGLPGVGRKRARQLLETFGSVASVFAADEAHLRQVRGIGMRTAAAIHRVAHARADCAVDSVSAATGSALEGSADSNV